jgi:altronate dehydratase small subunit
MSKNSHKGWDAVVLNPTDELATALHHLKAGDVARFLVGTKAQELKMSTDVALCHKFAIRDVTLGEKLRKYGEIIGEASKPITAGEHAHVHNIKSLRAIHKRF